MITYTRPYLALMPLLVILMFAAGQAAAQDEPMALSVFSKQKQSTGAFPCAPGPFSSDIDPEECSDFVFIVNQGPWLDTACLFRDQVPNGRLVIELEVDRYFGDPDKMIRAGLMDPFATLSIPAFDVDSSAVVEDRLPEWDHVYFNGNLVPGEILRGENQQWKFNSFRIPMDWVQFPSPPGNGPVEPAINTIEILIDTGNSVRTWCTSIDWVSLSIGATRPVIFAHGILSSGSTFNEWGDQLFDEFGLYSDNRAGARLDMHGLIGLDSIQNNAGDISDHLDRLADLWNFEKFNIVAHSKGGLDSRYYLRSSDKVDTLVMVGTPNRGSLIADVIQAGALPFAPGLVGLAALAGPAGWQLTVTYMTQVFNGFVGFNPETNYYTVAGDYDPLCESFCAFDVDEVLLNISGRPGDVIVRESSVHFSPRLDGISTHPSQGEDETATHTRINKAAGVLRNHVVPRLAQSTGRKTSLRKQGAVEAAPPAELQATAFQAGGINDGMNASQQVVPIDSPTAIVLYAPAEIPLNIELDTPAGATLRGSALGQVSSQGTLFDLAIYTFLADQLGDYTLRFSAENPSDEFFYVITAAPGEGSAGATVRLTTPLLIGGEMAIVEAQIDGGTANATLDSATASMLTADSRASEVELRDDGVAPDAAAGDGRYSAAATLMDGEQVLEVELAFSNGARRSASFPLVATTQGTEQLTYTFTEVTTDEDRDSLIDELVIGAEVTAAQPGEHLFTATLDLGSSLTLITSASADITTGTAAVVEFEFPGKDLFLSQQDGPYELVRIEALRVEGDRLLPLRPVEPDYQTEAYDYRDFERRIAEVLEVAAATPLDEDRDGFAELLAVDILVDLASAGSWQWSGVLRDANGNELAFAGDSGPAGPGEVTLTLLFSGDDIGRNPYTLPLYLDGIIVVGGGGGVSYRRSFELPDLTGAQFTGCDARCRILRRLLAEDSPFDPVDFNEDGVVDIADLLLAVDDVGGDLDPFEPDETVFDAAPLIDGGPAVTRAIDPADDSDWFVLENYTVPSVVVTTVTTSLSSSVRVDLYDAQLQRQESAVISIGEESQTISVTRLAEEAIYLRVQHSDRSTTVPAYSVVARSVPLDFPAIAPGDDPIADSISPGERDYFQLTITESGRYTLETAGPSGDSVLVLYDASFNPIAQNDDGGPGLFSRLVVDLEPGSYIVEVRGFNSASAIPEYTLTVTRETTAP